MQMQLHWVSELFAQPLAPEFVQADMAWACVQLLVCCLLQS
jgi:hypothetical protein